MSRRQSVFFLPIDPRKEDHKDPEYIDYSVPRHARYLQNAWKDIKIRYFGSILILESSKKFYQTRSNAIILQGTLPAHCISRAERLKTGEVLYERQHLSPRPPPKISLRRDLNWNKGQDQVLQLNIDQSENSFNSHLEKHFNLVLPSQPNPLNQSKIVRRNP